MLIAGAAGLLLFTVMWLQQAHAGFGVAAGVGLFVAGSVLSIALGVARTAKRTIPTTVAVGVPAAVLVTCIGLGPLASTAFCQSEEIEQWDTLIAAQRDDDFDPSRWQRDYAGKVHEPFRRDGWRGQWMNARVTQATRARNATALRAILGEIASDTAGDNYDEARAAAQAAFMGYYDEAKAKMDAPAAGGGEREFPVDDALRAAFSTVLADLAASPEPHIHVAFANAVDLTPAEGTDDVLALFQAGPEVRAKFPGGAPIIAAGDAFSSRYDHRRQATFMRAMSESFGHVFDAQLLQLVPLRDGAATHGKLVLEVSSEIFRRPDFYLYDKGDASGRTELAGLMFSIGVRWRFRLLDRDGTVLYAPDPVVSNPAGEVSVQTAPGDPDWAMYSTMMDSAYYNYSRAIAGGFGLVPPPQRTVFAYTR